MKLSLNSSSQLFCFPIQLTPSLSSLAASDPNKLRRPPVFFLRGIRQHQMSSSCLQIYESTRTFTHPPIAVLFVLLKQMRCPSICCGQSFHSYPGPTIFLLHHNLCTINHTYLSCTFKSYQLSLSYQYLNSGMLAPC